MGDEIIKGHEINSLVYRVLVVAAKPLLILCAVQLSDQIASDLAKVFIWTAFITPVASLSIYKTYMSEAILNGYLVAVPKIITHTACFFLIILVSKYAFQFASIFVCVFVADFFFHQISRIFLYQKKILVWALINIIQSISIFALVVINSYNIGILNVFMVIIGLALFASFGSALVFLKKKDWVLEVEMSQSFFGSSRKALMSMDRIAASLLIDNEKFWVIGILFQISGAAAIGFDATKIMPKKRDIALQKLKKKDLNVFKANFHWSVVSAITSFGFLFSQFRDVATVIMVIPVFLYRGIMVNDLSVNLEVFFWRNRLGLATAVNVFFVSIFAASAIFIYQSVSYLPALFISAVVAAIMMQLTNYIFNSGYLNKSHVDI